MKKIQKRCKIINVTARDIAKGNPDEPDSCPVARAIARSFKKKVGYWEVYGKNFERSRTNSIVRAPSSVKTFVNRFDNGDTVSPFTFTLEY